MNWLFKKKFFFAVIATIVGNRKFRAKSNNHRITKISVSQIGNGMVLPYYSTQIDPNQRVYMNIFLNASTSLLTKKNMK